MVSVGFLLFFPEERELSPVLPDGVGRTLRGAGEHGGTPKIHPSAPLNESLQTLSVLPAEWDYHGEKTCGGNASSELCETLWEKKKIKTKKSICKANIKLVGKGRARLQVA